MFSVWLETHKVLLFHVWWTKSVNCVAYSSVSSKYRMQNNKKLKIPDTIDSLKSHHDCNNVFCFKFSKQFWSKYLTENRSMHWNCKSLMIQCMMKSDFMVERVWAHEHNPYVCVCVCLWLIDNIRVTVYVYVKIFQWNN